MSGNDIDLVHAQCAAVQFFLRLSALGLIILDTAPTRQSIPIEDSLFCRSNPVTPDSQAHLADGSTDDTQPATSAAS